MVFHYYTFNWDSVIFLLVVFYRLHHSQNVFTVNSFSPLSCSETLTLNYTDRDQCHDQ